MVGGVLLLPNGSPAVGATVRAVPADHVPSLADQQIPSFPTATTNAKGEYGFPTIDSGLYNLEGTLDSLGVLIDSVHVPDDTNTVHVADAYLHGLGRIVGVTHMVGQSDTDQVRVTLYMPGTWRITKPSIGGAFRFDWVAAGSYQLIVDPAFTQYRVVVMDVEVVAGQTLDLDTIMLTASTPDTVSVVASSVDGVWGPARTYLILDQVEVPVGATLTIMPATRVVFMGNFSMDVRGTLLAAGTADSMVCFTYRYDSGKWGHINAAGRVELSHCILEKAYDGLIAAHAETTVVVRNCVFRYCQNQAVLSDAGPQSLDVLNSVFHGMSQAAVRLAQECTARIANCIFVDNNEGIQWTDSLLAQLTLRSNCFFASTWADMVVGTVHTPYTPGPATATIVALPLFVDTTAGSEDYHLQANSPCRGSGVGGTDMGVYSTYQP
jgi:hypothetical protein